MPENIKRILCILTGSKKSARAEEWAIFMAKNTNALVEFFHVVDSDFLEGLPRAVDMEKEIDDELDFVTKKLIADLEKKLEGNDIKYEVTIKHGHSEKEFITESKEKQPDMIIMPYEKRGMLGFLLVKGLDHARIIDDSDVPVLVVK